MLMTQVILLQVFLTVDLKCTLTYIVQTQRQAHYYVVCGYKGTSPYDAGMFYCICTTTNGKSSWSRYFPTENHFKTRYGLHCKSI